VNGAAEKATQALRFRRVLPWLVFGLGFLFTTAIGATVIGLSHGSRWGLDPGRAEALGLDVRELDDSVFGNPDYWSLLLVCSLVPLAGAIVAAITTSRLRQSQAPLRLDSTTAWIARAVFAGGIFWLMFRVYTSVPDPLGTIRTAWTGTLEDHYQVRYQIMSLLGPHEFGLAYTGLLSLLALPLYQALISRKTRGSWFELVVWLVAYWVVAIILVQKLLISLSLLMSAFAFCSAKGLFAGRIRLLFLSLLFFGVIHVVMTTLLPSWTLVATIDHIIGRSADSYPYAIAMAPKHHFSGGQFLAGSIVGRTGALGESVNPNVDLYDAMYPNNEGAVALAAPVWSYYDVGMLGALLSLAIVLAICAVTSRLAFSAGTSPWAWTFFLLLLMQIYHLTQIPVLGILFWGYGISHGLIAIVIVGVLSALARARSQQIR
jgi:hypothetical protein